jgi:hypothetical protein
VVPITGVNGPNRPSSERAASIAACCLLAVGHAAGLARAVGDGGQRCVVARLQRRQLGGEKPGEHAERCGGGRRVLGIRVPGRRRGEIRAVTAVDAVDCVVDRALDHGEAHDGNGRRLLGHADDRRRRGVVPIRDRVGASERGRKGRAQRGNSQKRADATHAGAS